MVLHLSKVLVRLIQEDCVSALERSVGLVGTRKWQFCT